MPRMKKARAPIPGFGVRNALSAARDWGMMKGKNTCASRREADAVQRWKVLEQIQVPLRSTSKVEKWL